MRVGYLGPEGSYTHLAALRMRPNADHMPYSGFSALISSLVSGETGGIIVPIENALNGGVVQVMDLLQSNDGLVAVEESRLKIDHRLITSVGADLRGIKRIYSHEQALKQCAKYLAENFPCAEQIPVSSTTAGLDMILSPSDAGIAGAHTHRAGLAVSSENIADEKNNFTYFLYVIKGEIPENTHSRRVYFSVTCKNVPGALLRILGPVSHRGLNMTKIESRPIKNRDEEYRFFIETDGDYASDNVKGALEEIKAESNSFRLLGCY